MVDSGGHLDRVIRGGVQGVGEAGPAEFRIVLLRHAAVPGFHGRREGVRGNAQVRGQLFIAFAADHQPTVDVALDDGGRVHHLLVHHQPAEGAGLCDFGGGHHITGTDFVDEPFAVSVHQDRAVAAQAFRDQGRRIRLHGRMDLDLVHVHRRRAEFRGHQDALALDAGRVGRHEAFQLRGVAGDHLQVGAESAGGKDHGLGFHGDLVAGLADGFHADDRAGFIRQQFFSRYVGQDRQVVPRGAGLFQDRDHISADGNRLAFFVDRAVDPLDGRAAEGRHVVQVSADRAQPFDGGRAVVHQGIDQLRIVQALAADQGVQGEQFRRIKVAFGSRLPGFPLFLHFCGQRGDRFVVRVLLRRSRQGLLQAGVLAELVRVLPFRLRGVHAARGFDGVSADGGLAFQYQDALPGVGCGQRGHHAGAARADDRDVRFDGHVDGGLIVREFPQVVVRVHAGVLQREAHGFDDRLPGDAGEGRSGIGVHNAVVFHKGRRPLFQDLAADAGGFAVAGHLNRDDVAVFQDDADRNLPAETLHSGCSGRLCNGFRAYGCARHEHHDRCEDCDEPFFHGIPPLDVPVVR